jgi:hypothetical protein
VFQLESLSPTTHENLRPQEDSFLQLASHGLELPVLGKASIWIEGLVWVPVENLMFGLFVQNFQVL